MAQAPQTEKILKVAGLSVGLGLFMELALLIAAGTMGNMPAGKAIIADLAQKISWGTVVCVGVAVGAAASRSHVRTGIMGFLSAPAGFYFAKAIHKGANQALGIAAPAAAMGPSPLLLALIKAVQYGLLGYGISRLYKKEDPGAFAHIAVGVLSGLIFGGLIIYLFNASNPLTTSQFVTRAINEFLFPVGCASVLYAAKSFRRS